MSDPTPVPTPGAPDITPQEVDASTGGSSQSPIDQALGLAQTAAALATTIDPKAATIITIVSGLLDLVEEAWPTVSQMVASGQLSVDDANAYRDRWNEFVANGQNMFAEPQWQVQS